MIAGLKAENPTTAASTTADSQTARPSSTAGLFRAKSSPPRPLVPIALAAVTGVIADRSLRLEVTTWVMFAFVLFSFGILCWRLRRLGVAEVLLALCVIPCAAAWSWRSTNAWRYDDFAAIVGDEPRVFAVRGVIATKPKVRRNDPNSAALRSFDSPTARFELVANEARNGDQWTAIRGRLAVSVPATAKSWIQGQHIEIVGLLGRPTGPMNAGGFNYPAYLQDRGIVATLVSQDAGSVRILDEPSPWAPMLWRERIRAWSALQGERALSPELAGLLQAVVLGDEQGMTQGDFDLYQRTGSLHLLVVSGQHLMVLAGVFWGLGAVIGFPMRWRAGLVIGLLCGYAFLTGTQPPALRAAVVACFFFGGMLVRRRPEPLNSLAAAMIALIILDPRDMVGIGPRLSFLAVLAIVLFAVPLARWPRLATVRLNDHWSVRLRQAASRIAIDYLVVSLVVWIVIAPLALAEFHLVSPVGVALSILLAPVMTVALVAGMVFLLTAALIPSVAGIFASVCGLALEFMRETASAADALPGGCLYLPSPPPWWTIGFYCVLLLPWLVSRTSRLSIGYTMANLAWLLVGVSATALTEKHPFVEYHQLSVGHGICSLLRFPSGETVMYDCGSLRGPEIGERVIAPWLWEQKIGRIDAVLISHADIDHFNGLVAIAQKIPIGAVYITPQMARAKAESVQRLFSELRRLGVPIQLTWKNDRWIVGNITLTAIQPGANAKFESDNAASMVVDCRIAGSTLLLTGDVDGDGLTELLSQDVGQVAVLVAPHHGAASSNTERVADWANSRLVVCSDGRRHSKVDSLLPHSAGGARVLRTSVDGGIRVDFQSEELRVRAFRGGEWTILRQKMAENLTKTAARLDALRAP